jgi:signal transduction histidine kinase
MLVASIILTSISQVLLVLFVFLKGRKNLTNILFALIGVSSLAWALSSYFSIVLLNSPNVIDVVRLILFCVVWQNTFFYLFAKVFPDTNWHYSKKHLYGYLVFSAAVSVSTLSPIVFTGVKVSEGSPVAIAGPGMLLFVVHASFSIIQAFRFLGKKYQKSKGTLRRQLQILILASVLVWVVVPVTNFAITPLLKTTFFIELSPVYTFIFAGIIAYAIISSKLFDIRAALARSVGYILSLGFIGLLFSTAAYLALTWIGPDHLTDSFERGIYIGLALVTALTYPYAKAFFEKVTTRLFFKDAYDTQEFLNELNEVLVQKIVLDPLLSASANIISENLKSSKTTFIIRETAYFPLRIIGDPINLSKEDHELLKERTVQVADKIVVADQLEESDQLLRRFMVAKDIAVLGRLVSNVEYLIEGVGYLSLGPKRNGEPYSKKDLEVLEIITNELVIAVENGLRFEEIEAFNNTLQDKIDLATKQLKRTNDKLKALDETKDEFISMASHQLRTPLTSVKGYVSMVLEGDAGELNDMQRKLLEQSFISSQRMVYLIADLLNLSRLRTGKFVIEAVPSNLSELIQGEVEQLTATAAGRKLKLAYKKPESFPTLMLDETKIRQVIMNFVDNAIYYTPAGGTIEINLRETNDIVEFTVHDDGIGVPKSEQPHLFNKFYRAKNAQKARPDGTGLGLFMAKKVIVAQGGALVFSSSEGKGSTFGFTFSKAKLKVPVPKPAADTDQTK